MNLSRLTGLKNNRNLGSFLGSYKIILHCRYCKQRRNCYMVLINSSVGENEYVDTFTVMSVSFNKKTVDCFLHRCILIIYYRKNCNLKAFLLHILNLEQIRIGKNRIVDSKYLTVSCCLFKNISVRSKIHCCRCDNLLSESINRRIRNLCKKLLKIVKQRNSLS